MNTGGDYTFEIKTVWIKSQSSLSQSHYQRIEFGAPTKGNSYQSSQQQQQPHQKHKQNEKRNVYDLLSSKKRPKENWCDKTELVVVNVVFAAAVAACCSISICSSNCSFMSNMCMCPYFTHYRFSSSLPCCPLPLLLWFHFDPSIFVQTLEKKIKIEETKKNTQRKIPSLVLFINNVPARREWAC